MPILTWKLPVTLPSPNKREHWGTRNARNKLIREYLGLLWDNTPQKPTLPIHIDLIRKASKKMDYDNLVASLKGTRDAVADLLLPGLNPGQADGDSRLTWHYSEQKGSRHGEIIISFYDEYTAGRACDF